MPFKILFITPWFPNNQSDGTYNYIYHSIEALRQKGNIVSVLVTRPWTPRVFGYLHPDWLRNPLDVDSFDPNLSISVRYYPSIPRNCFQYLATWLFRAILSAEIRRLVREIDADIIHVHTETTGIAVVPLAQELGIPSVVTIHGINSAPRLLNTKRKRERLRRTLLNADRVILVGEPLRKYFATLCGGDKNFRVVPNGFYLHDYSRRSRAWKSGLQIISVSNLHEGKGIDISLVALALCERHGIRDWHYVVVGDGRERQRLEEMATNLGIKEKVEFKGHLPHNEALNLLEDANIFLLPSYREAFGVAYLEAMASGLLTIGVSGQGPEAFIRNGETGFLIPPQDPESVYRLLMNIHENKVEVQQIAASGRDFIHSEYKWSRHAEKLMDIYSEIGGVIA